MVSCVEICVWLNQRSPLSRTVNCWFEIQDNWFIWLLIRARSCWALFLDEYLTIMLWWLCTWLGTGHPILAMNYKWKECNGHFESGKLLRLNSSRYIWSKVMKCWKLESLGISVQMMEWKFISISFSAVLEWIYVAGRIW